MKVRDVLKRLHEDGWALIRQRGSHRIFGHPEKGGIVVVPGHPGDDIPAGTRSAIFKQAQLEDRS